jgi:DNA mismatch repair ATPase MutS
MSLAITSMFAAPHAEKLMQDDQFIHRQTTAQTVRFTTTELAELERDLSTGRRPGAGA